MLSSLFGTLTSTLRISQSRRVSWSSVRGTYTFARALIDESQVENTLFKVPKSIFDESSVFSDMFAMPQDGCQSVDGRSDQQPLKLEQVALADFEAFLFFLIPQ
jgi:hypothetical protein